MFPASDHHTADRRASSAQQALGSQLTSLRSEHEPAATGSAPPLLERYLRATNRSEWTVGNYLENLHQVETFLHPRGVRPRDATRADLEDFIADLLKACEGKGFEARRDTALIMLLLDTGARRDELMSRTLTDLDQDLDVLLVLGKGRRERALPYGHKTALALDRYLRVRERHKDANLPWLWLGLRGRLTAWGLVRMLERRGREAGLAGLHPHQFRHTFAHQWPAEGGAEVDLMRLAGWRSRAMVARYGAAPPTPAPATPTADSPSATGCSRECILIRVLPGAWFPWIALATWETMYRWRPL